MESASIVQDALNRASKGKFNNIDKKLKKMLCKINIACMKGRTTLIITHRLSTIPNAAKIVVIDQGTVIEEGRRNQLLFTRNMT